MGEVREGGGPTLMVRHQVMGQISLKLNRGESTDLKRGSATVVINE